MEYQQQEQSDPTPTSPPRQENDLQPQEQDPTLVLKQFPLQMQDINRFRYRTSDVYKSVTDKAIRATRARDLQEEALKSAKLQAHFEDNPNDMYALQKAQREFKHRKGNGNSHSTFLSKCSQVRVLQLPWRHCSTPTRRRTMSKCICKEISASRGIFRG